MAGEGLICPVPFYQSPAELAQLLARVRELKPRRILEIGSLYGGTLWHWMESCTGALVVSVDMVAEGVPQHPIERILEARAHWERWAAELCCLLKYYTGPSDHAQILDAARRHAPYDFIFIDGGHLYHQVEADYLNYWPMLRPGGLMAFHDIAYPDGFPGIGVGTWWRDLKQATGGHGMREIRKMQDQTWGIGLIWKDPE